MIDFSRQMYISYQSIVGIRNDRSARAHIILMHGILHEGLSQWGERFNKKCGHIAALGRSFGEAGGRQGGQANETVAEDIHPYPNRRRTNNRATFLRPPTPALHCTALLPAFSPLVVFGVAQSIHRFDSIRYLGERSHIRFLL